MIMPRKSSIGLKFFKVGNFGRNFEQFKKCGTFWKTERGGRSCSTSYPSGTKRKKREGQNREKREREQTKSIWKGREENKTF